MKRVLTIKRGSSFDYTIAIDSEETINLENISSQIRSNSDDFVDDLQVSSTDLENVFIVSKEDTSEWPLETLYFDVRYTIDDKIYFTDTIAIKVIKQQTIVEETD